MRIWAESALVDDAFADHVLLEVDAAGVLAAVTVGAPRDGADLALGTVVPGLQNTHSHAFHRLLRGRTNANGGDFWTWRSAMYEAVATLTPELVHAVALAVYSEMLDAGYTAVGEFHYLHHDPTGRPYPGHDMELAIAAAADDVGIALTLLDTCYLSSGFGAPLGPEQQRFGDGTVEQWSKRWHDLRGTLARQFPSVVLGAAIHSVRAMTGSDIATLVAALPPDVPLHVHLSEQRRENEDAEEATGRTPTRILADAGALADRLTVVHATHLTTDDIATLGAAGVSVSMCPTTEADLGDGLGEAAALVAAGARITIGSDQNVLLDPFAELRALEGGARMAAHRRGIFSPAELWAVGTRNGFAALQHRGAIGGRLAVGARADLVELDPRSARTAGSRPDQLMFAASAADVTRVVLGGRVRDAAPTADLAAAAFTQYERSRA